MGRSQRRAIPKRCGRCPSIAALTRSGARKASDIVMLTLRTLHPARLAMLSVVAAESSISSLSQQRPCAIAAISVAFVSERMGRRCCCDGSVALVVEFLQKLLKGEITIQTLTSHYPVSSNHQHGLRAVTNNL